MNKKRLLKLADFLETIPRKVFNIDRWETRPQTKPEGEKPGECGFAGCAVGWAAHAKLFRGFRLSRNINILPQPSYKGRTGFGAVEEVFGLTLTDAEDLFLCMGYPTARSPLDPTPKEVARKIRKLVKASE